MLTAHQITYAAGGKTILEGVTLAFNPGQIHLIIGPNGAGKSTLFAALRGKTLPLPILWQHLPGADHFAERPLQPEDLLIWRITRSLAAYNAACGT